MLPSSFLSFHRFSSLFKKRRFLITIRVSRRHCNSTLQEPPKLHIKQTYVIRRQWQVIWRLRMLWKTLNRTWRSRRNSRSKTSVLYPTTANYILSRRAWASTSRRLSARSSFCSSWTWSKQYDLVVEEHLAYILLFQIQLKNVMRLRTSHKWRMMRLYSRK